LWGKVGDHPRGEAIFGYKVGWQHENQAENVRKVVVKAMSGGELFQFFPHFCLISACFK
jgi:hypothetical protein